MPLTVAQVLNPPTEEDNLRFLIDSLASLGFAVTSWQEGSVQRNVLQAVARGMTGSANTVSAILRKTLVEPEGEWLDVIGIIRFGIERIPAIQTERDVTFTAAASAPASQFIQPGTFVATNGVRYYVTSAVAVGPLTPGNTLTTSVRAELPGANGNQANDAALSLQGAHGLTGVTVAFDGDPTIEGTDKEIDSRYWLRCKLRWAAMTYASGLRAYEFWALTADASIDRVKALNNYPTPNAVRVVLDPGTPAQIANVEAYIADKHPPNDDVTVSQRSVYNQSIVLNPQVPYGTKTSDLTAAIDAYLNSMAIGGVVPAGSVVGKLLPEQIAKVLLCSKGAASAGLVTPSAPVILGATDIVIATYTINPEYF